MIQNKFLTSFENQNYVSDTNPIDNLQCIDDTYCYKDMIKYDPISSECAKYVLEKPNSNQMACQFRDYSLPTGTRIECSNGQQYHGIIASPFMAEMSVFCGNSHVGVVQIPSGRTLTDTNCQLSYQNNIILPADPNGPGKNEAPKFNVDSDEKQLVYQLFGGTTAAMIVFTSTVVGLIYRNKFKKTICCWTLSCKKRTDDNLRGYKSKRGSLRGSQNSLESNPTSHKGYNAATGRFNIDDEESLHESAKILQNQIERKRHLDQRLRSKSKNIRSEIIELQDDLETISEATSLRGNAPPPEEQ